jgi:hypothetical protein
MANSCANFSKKKYRRRRVQLLDAVDLEKEEAPDDHEGYGSAENQRDGSGQGQLVKFAAPVVLKMVGDRWSSVDHGSVVVKSLSA